MALVLTVFKNRSFYIGDIQIKVVNIPDYKTMDVEVGEAGDPLRLDDDYLELFPQVYIRSGHHPSATSSKVLISAPRSIVILRDTHYHNAQHRSHNGCSYQA